MNLLWGKSIAASLSALAKLGVADQMGDEPATAESLAAATGANAGALYRVMRMLASIGVFQNWPGSASLSHPWAAACAPTPRTRCAASP